VKNANRKSNNFILVYVPVPGNKRSLCYHVFRIWFLALLACFLLFHAMQFEVKAEN